MAFVILSTGSLTGSRLRTLRASSLLLAIAMLLLVTLVGGIGLGYRYGHLAVDSSFAAAAELSSLERPERRALIDRIGTLSGRMIQLESEAQALTARLGTIEGTGQRTGPAPARTLQADTQPGTPPVETTAPSGGPLVPVPETGDVDDEIGLTTLERDVDQVSMSLDKVEAAMAPRELENMAFPNRPPISRPITSGFGKRVDPFTRRLARHTGIDIGAPLRTPIRAAGGGRVTFAGFRSAYGYTVEIDHGHGLSTRYGHASRLLVRRGDVVLPQQEIAVVGSTGRSTGPHLHFEVLRHGVPVEPRTFLQHRGA
jgi:murein DD-endopeptidase MepM/ murein hydrolase activator NlpD